jgi:hypothetical protein
LWRNLEKENEGKVEDLDEWRLYEGVTRLDLIHYFKNCAKTPWNTGSMSVRVLCQPPSQAIFGFRAADVTSAVIGNGDNNREAWGMGQNFSPWVTQGVLPYTWPVPVLPMWMLFVFQIGLLLKGHFLCLAKKDLTMTCLILWTSHIGLVTKRGLL